MCNGIKKNYAEELGKVLSNQDPKEMKRLLDKAARHPDTAKQLEAFHRFVYSTLPFVAPQVNRQLSEEGSK